MRILLLGVLWDLAEHVAAAELPRASGASVGRGHHVVPYSEATGRGRVLGY